MPSDYIMRLIEEIATFLSGIIAKQHGGQYAEVRSDLDKKCVETIGLPVRDVIQLSPEAVAQTLETAGALRYSRAIMLAELLLQDASIGDAEGNNSRAPLDHLHAFCLLFDSIHTLDEDEQKVYRSKLDMLAIRLRELPANSYIGGKLQAYESSKG